MSDVLTVMLLLLAHLYLKINTNQGLESFKMFFPSKGKKLKLIVKHER